MSKTKWQPIESAPRDEPILLALTVRNNKSGAEWWEMHSAWVRSDDEQIGSYGSDPGWTLEDFTHWMPLPDPPQ